MNNRFPQVSSIPLGSSKKIHSQETAFGMSAAIDKFCQMLKPESSRKLFGSLLLIPQCPDSDIFGVDICRESSSHSIFPDVKL